MRYDEKLKSNTCTLWFRGACDFACPIARMEWQTYHCYWYQKFYPESRSSGLAHTYQCVILRIVVTGPGTRRFGTLGSVAMFSGRQWAQFPPPIEFPSESESESR
jgi:hypothetical protein